MQNLYVYQDEPKKLFISQPMAGKTDVELNMSVLFSMVLKLSNRGAYENK